MGVIRQKLKDGLHRFEDKVRRLDKSIQAKKQAVKSAYLWFKGKLKKEEKHYDIRKSLKRLADRASWPRSTMEKYFQNEILPLIGTDAELKKYMTVKSLRALPKVARNGSTAAGDFFGALLEAAKKDSTLISRCVFVVEGAEALPALAKASPEVFMKVTKGMLQMAGDNKDLNRRVYDAAIKAVPVLVKHDHKLKPVLPGLVTWLRAAAGDDSKQPMVYRELAVSPANPDSGHVSLIIPMGGPLREPYVFAGCFTGLASEFARAVDKKYPYNARTPGRLHYDAVMNFVRDAFEITSPQPSLRDAIEAKVMGAAPVTGTAWAAAKKRR